MRPLLVLLFLMTAAGGAGVVFSRKPRRMVLALSANGLILALLFFALQAPDVAYSEIVVGTAAVPLLYYGTLSSIRANRTRDE
jgi:energy-converting hydrogenase B subunit D